MRGVYRAIEKNHDFSFLIFDKCQDHAGKYLEEYLMDCYQNVQMTRLLGLLLN